MFSSAYEELMVFLIASVPILELRTAMLVAIEQYKMHWLKAFLLSIGGNIFPVIPILMILKPVSEILMKYSFFNKFFTWLSEHTRKKSDELEKYETLGLMIFVAIPLPLTGAWSGCIAAFIFGIRFWYAFTAISVGIVLAGIIVVTLIKFGYFWALINAIILIPMTAVGGYKILIAKHQDTITI